MATMFYRKQRAEIDFNDDNFENLSDKKRENRPRKIEDCQLQALLDGRGRYPIAKNACRAIGCF